jgi:hypothetical protein
VARLAATLALKTENTNAHSNWIKSVAFSPDGTKIVSGSDDKTIKVWDAGAPNLIQNLIHHPLGPSLCPPSHPFVLPAGTFELLETRTGDAAIDKGGEVAERDGPTLRLKEGGAFYAPSPLSCVAVHWPRLVAGAQSGELYHLEVA